MNKTNLYRLHKYSIQLSFNTGITYPKADAAGTPLSVSTICTGHVCHEYPFKHYKKDTSTVCLRQHCDHQIDACTTSRYCVHEAQHTVQHIFIYLLQPKRNASVVNDKYRRLEIDA